jgi:serine protease Do
MKRKIVSFILSISVILGLTSCLNFQGDKDPDKIEKEPTIVQIQNEITEVYEQAAKGCVGIYGTSQDSASGGSGVIYKENNGVYYVVTNAHVVDEMTKVQIHLGGVKYYQATVVGKDTKNDIAVLKFSLDMFGGEVYVHDIFNYEDEESVKVGQTTLAIGCPLDLDNYNILTTGVVSKVTYSKIMTNAELNPGNSGGGLFNLSGRLIGINSEKQVWTSTTDDYGKTEQIPVEGMGFAIPINDVKIYVQNLEKGENISRPIIGVSLINVTDRYKLYYYRINVDSSITSGVVIAEIQRGGAADKAGLKVGDVITKLDDKEVDGISKLRYYLYKYNIGDKVKVTFIRNGKTNTTEVTLEGN